MTKRGDERRREAAERAFDLEPRTETFAREVRAFVKLLPVNVTNREDVPQLVRCSGSVAANYIEANEALGTKDFRMRIRICRKEAKESRLFLRLMDTTGRPEAEQRRSALEREADELCRIFGAILRQHERNAPTRSPSS